MTLTPTNQENKGRFNRRKITLTGKKVGYNNDVFVGMTDTGKEVYVYPFKLSTTVGIRYTSDDQKVGYTYCSSLGWKNQYDITIEELEAIKSF